MRRKRIDEGVARRERRRSILGKEGAGVAKLRGVSILVCRKTG